MERHIGEVPVGDFPICLIESFVKQARSGKAECPFLDSAIGSPGLNHSLNQKTGMKLNASTSRESGERKGHSDLPLRSVEISNMEWQIGTSPWGIRDWNGKSGRPRGGLSDLPH